MKPALYPLWLLLVATGLLAGCGQTGALYLPDQAVKTPVEVHPAPADTSPADSSAAPTPEESRDKQQPKAPR